MEFKKSVRVLVLDKFIFLPIIQFENLGFFNCYVLWHHANYRGFSESSEGVTELCETKLMLEVIQPDNLFSSLPEF